LKAAAGGERRQQSLMALNVAQCQLRMPARPDATGQLACLLLKVAEAALMGSLGLVFLALIIAAGTGQLPQAGGAQRHGQCPKGLIQGQG